MEKLIEIFNYGKDHLDYITTIIAYMIAIASVIVKLTPSVKDDNILKGIIKFLGKYIALDKYGPDGKE